MASELYDAFINGVIESNERSTYTDDPLEIRKQFNEMCGLPPVWPDVDVEDIKIEHISAGWIKVKGTDDKRVMLYLHGGGFVFGSTVTHRPLITALSRSSACRTLAVNYRLAPEFPFPAALDDAVKSYKWLVESGVSPDNIIIAGDSAGGGLALSTLIQLRNEGYPLPAAAVCLSPWTDFCLDTFSSYFNADIDPLINKKENLRNANFYMGSESNPRNPLLSPVYANLRGLPPLLILVGTDETMLDDSVIFAERAKDSNVDVTIIVQNKMIHIWPFFIDKFPEALEAVTEIGCFIIKKTTR